MKKTKARRYPVPANYPIDVASIPDMPTELFHLAHTGHLMATERAEYGWHPLLCIECEGPLDLIYRHEPIALGDFKNHVMMFKHGDDVTAVCPRCSFRSLHAIGVGVGT